VITMDSQRFTAKLFTLDAAASVPKEDVVLFFHRVIQDRLLDEITVDVTDYSHVPDGPGVMLICHEAHYSMDRGGGRLGLRCAAKRGATGDTAERIRRVLRKVLRLAERMEAHEILGGRVKFDTRSALVSIEDRLVAPSAQETFDALAPVLAGVATDVWGAPPVLVRVGSPKEPFQVEMSAPVGPTVTDLLSRLGG
jgi:hypothetical protein